MNPQKLLEQFLAPNAITNLGGQQQPANVPATGGQKASKGQSGASIGELISGASGGLVSHLDAQVAQNLET